MVQSVIPYSEIIPTILAVVSIYFLGSGILDHKREFMFIGVGLFLLAVILPFVILINMI